MDDEYDEYAGVSDDELMERCRAARAFLKGQEMSAGPHNDDIHRYAFLSLFHPEMSHQEKQAFNRDCRGAK